MAQVKPLKINANGLPEEVNTTSDDITLASFTVNGGAVLSSTGLDMNGTNISDAGDLAFTDPTTDGITRTDGTHAADDIMMQDAENVMSASAGAILFSTITDTGDQVDAFRLPSLAGAPSATPTDGGEGYLVWDNLNDNLYAWDGAAWNNLSIVEEVQRTFNEIPAGDLDNQNLLYTTEFEFIPDSLEVYLSGIRLNGDQNDPERDFDIITTGANENKGFQLRIEPNKYWRLNGPPLQNESLIVNYNKLVTFNTKGGN